MPPKERGDQRPRPSVFLIQADDNPINLGVVYMKVELEFGCDLESSQKEVPYVILHFDYPPFFFENRTQSHFGT